MLTTEVLRSFPQGYGQTQTIERGRVQSVGELA